MTKRSAPAQHLRDLARLRRARDRMDRQNAEPLDVETLVRQEPTEQPYGVRDCAIRDPAGNLIPIQELS